jgi:regulator of cell morphogenesis and NO signaling
MVHQYGCHAQSSATAPETDAPITADLTVGDVAKRYPRALDAMKAIGINHCCGAHLTLNEAAASAGIALGSLLDALNRPAAATK